MRKIETILYPTDFSPCSQQALNHAIYLAERFGAELHILHAITLHESDPYNPAHHFPQTDDLFQRLLALARSEMERMRSVWIDREVRVQEVERRGIHAAPTILEYAEEVGADLIVMGTHGRRGPAHLFLGSVAEEVVRRAPCPVFTLRQLEEARTVHPIHRILVPVDFSDGAEASVTAAAELARAFGARLDLLHVIEPAVYPGFYGTFDAGVPVGIDDRALRQRSKEALQDLTRLAPEVGCEAHTRSGSPGSGIVDFAESAGSDLIVMATEGLTGLSRLLLGSTAEYVVRAAGCPVLTMHRPAAEPETQDTRRADARREKPREGVTASA